MGRGLVSGRLLRVRFSEGSASSMESLEVSEQTNLTSVEDPASAAPVEAASAPETESSETAAQTAAVDDAELDAASLMEQFLNDPSHDYKSLKYGDVMDGVIMHLDRDEILVDI